MAAQVDRDLVTAAQRGDREAYVELIRPRGTGCSPWRNGIHVEAFRARTSTARRGDLA
jgi:hypothetical protein